MAYLRITYCEAGEAGSEEAIDLGDIAEVRFGYSTDCFNKLVKEADSSEPELDGINCARDFCFSIIFKDDTPPLDLVAQDSIERDLWVDVLNHLVVTMKNLGQQKEYEIFLRKQFRDADKDDSKCLNLDEVKNAICYH